MKKNIYDRYTNQILKEVKISKEFMKATETLRDVQVAQQQLVKKFKSSDAKAKEKLKPELISLHKKVKTAEADFERVLAKEPVDLDIYEDKKPIQEANSSNLSIAGVNFMVRFLYDASPRPGFQFLPKTSKELDKINVIGKDKMANIILKYLIMHLPSKKGFTQAPGYDASSNVGGMFFSISKIDIERHLESMLT